MVRVTPLASAALLSLAAIEVVIAKSQQYSKVSSGFLDTCNQIATSISNASVVYYSRESSITTPRSGLTDLLSLGAVLRRQCALGRIEHCAIRMQRRARHRSGRRCGRAFPSLFPSPLHPSNSLPHAKRSYALLV